MYNSIDVRGGVKTGMLVIKFLALLWNTILIFFYDLLLSMPLGAFYCEGNEDDDDEFDDFADDEEDDDDKHLLNVLDDEEVWMAEDSLWWRPDDAVDFLEADYPSLLAEQLHRS